MYALFDPSACLCQSIMSSRQDMHLWLVFVLHRLFLRLSFVLSVPRPSLQTRVTLLLQMAFCLAELHLWSTKSSLQVKGSTYHHVQSTSLPFSLLFFLSLSLRLALALCHHSLCFHTFFFFYPPRYIDFNNLTLSQHQFSPCLFPLSLCSLQIPILSLLCIALYSTFVIIII